MTQALEEQPSDGTPDNLVAEFQARRNRLDQHLLSLVQRLTDLRLELQGDSQASLNLLTEAAQDMAKGRIFRKIDIEAKEALGALVSSLNRTLVNLQQLDASAEHQGTQVPGLTDQLDAIASDAEECNQSVMDRLDTLMVASDDATRAVQACQDGLVRLNGHQANLHSAMSRFLDRVVAGENQNALAQEVLEYIFAHQVATPANELDLAPVQDHLQKVGDEAFEILNILQFQDITRQKMEEVVILLKQFQSGLTRLLVIFDIRTEDLGAQTSSDRRVAIQDRIFDASLEANHRKVGLDDITAQFKKTSGS